MDYSGLNLDYLSQYISDPAARAALGLNALPASAPAAAAPSLAVDPTIYTQQPASSLAVAPAAAPTAPLAPSNPAAPPSAQDYQYQASAGLGAFGGADFMGSLFASGYGNTDAYKNYQAQLAAEAALTRVPNWILEPGNDLQGTTPASQIALRPGTDYILYDTRTGKLLARGSDAAAFTKMSDIIQNQLVPQGHDADWRLYQGGTDPNYKSSIGFTPEYNDNGTYYTLVGGDTPNHPFTLGGALKMILPVAAALIPGVGPAISGALGIGGSSAAAIGTGLAAAGGSVLGGVINGDSLGSILKGAALSGLGAGVGSSVFGGVGSGANGASSLGSAVSGAGGSTAGGLGGSFLNAAGEIVVPAAVKAGSAALGAGLGSAVGSGISSLASNFNPPDLSNPANFTIDPSAAPVDPITVTGAPAGAGVGNMSSLAALSLPQSVLDAIAKNSVPPAQPGTTVGTEDIVSKGVRPSGPAATGGAGAAFGNAFNGLDFSQYTNPITVTADKPTTPSNSGATAPLIAAGAGAAAAGAAAAGSSAAPVEDIVVKGTPPKAYDPTSAVLPNGALAALETLPTTATPLPATKAPLSTTDKVLTALKAAGLLSAAFGGSGGSGSGAGAKLDGSFGGGGAGTFGSPLPTANLPGLTTGTGGARPASSLSAQTPQDWYRYGYGPQQSFFNYVPQGAPNTSKAYTGYAAGGAVGEEPLSLAVPHGPLPDGRSDSIPARLSDGEYVMDAETVALLGNGSNKAGAQKLDQFRVNVRKQKGKQLAKGSLSVNAKRPEQYLPGGIS